MNKVLVTGLGMITPLGPDRDSTFAAALAAHSAIRPAPADICAGLPNLLTASIDTDPLARLDRQHAGLDRATLLALVAADEAMAQAGLSQAIPEPSRFGAYAGVGFAGAHTLDAMYSRYFQALHNLDKTGRNATVMHPLSVPRMMANAPAAALSMRHGLRGTTNTYAVGDIVKTAASADANGVPMVAKATASDVPLGIIVGIRVADPGVSLAGTTLDLASNYIPKTKARNYYVYVVDDPMVLFEVQFDSTAVALTDLHKNAALTITADQTSTLSQSSPSSSTVLTSPATTNTLPIRLLGLVQRADNGTGAYARVVAKFNIHEFGVGTGTNFTGV